MSDLSPLWCANDEPHEAHSSRSEFGGTNYCTGRPAIQVVEHQFEIPPAAVYYRDTRWQKMYAPNSEPGWRVDGIESVYRWYSWDHPTIKVCNTEEEAKLEVLRASFESLDAAEAARFALNEPERVASILERLGDA